MKRQLWTILGSLAMGLATVACGGESETTTIPPGVGPLPPPGISLNTINPSNFVLGQPLLFDISVVSNAQAGYASTDAFLVTVTPPLGSRIGVETIDIFQVPGCGVTLSFCNLNNYPIDAREVLLTVSGDYLVTVSVLDAEGRVAQAEGVIRVDL
ncbi:MAG: hypothetical protein NW237_15615 [Cyanobacteriota bacterium]|nr:hypothetical protein [Cyanobacteriota bacterium]